MSLSDNTPSIPPRVGRTWWLRFAIACLGALALVVIWITNTVLTERFSAATRSEAEVRLALFSGQIVSELRRHAIVPQLLARDPRLITALETSDFSQSSQRLIEYRDEIGAARLMMLDRDGRAVASSDRVDLGSNHRPAAYHVNALRANQPVFTLSFTDVGLPQFFYSQIITNNGVRLGVIAVEVNLQKYEQSWTDFAKAVLVQDSSGKILLTSEPRWRGLSEEDALKSAAPASAIQRALQARVDWVAGIHAPVLRGEAVMRSEARIPFQGWRIVGYSTFASVRARVNGVLAFEVMAFAILAAALFYIASRQANLRSLRLQRESTHLRELNALLQREIAERERAEKNLEVAEQSLAQSSKLAALGEMSAAVSHELNQPLAAMKTYIAGARLLLQRQRPDEAVASFQRINDLIDRMAAITRQLKSYAGKGEGEMARVDLRNAVTSAVEMMQPQFRQSRIRLALSQPETEVAILADQFRLEQVIVNLLRNAVDATRGTDAPEVSLILSRGRTATLTVLDNGSGIDDLDALFEPFYSTKAPGDGLGLGLAISSSIVNDLGGRLTARNRPEGGAVFTLSLPLYGQDSLAAE